jgi:5,10-methylenetetrahydromethanopterin reductase
MAGARPVKSGVLLTSEYPAERLIELGRLVEALGYDYLWYADQRFQRDCYSGLTALALNTTRIALGAGVNDPYSRHPALTAMSLATLDETSHGRAFLGLGVGNSGIREMGLYKGKPVAALREAIEIIQGLLRGETIGSEGRVFELSPVALRFKPVRPRVPLLMISQGEQVIRLAGELADGVLFGNTAYPPSLRPMIANVAAGAERAGRSLESVEIGVRLEACLSDNWAAALHQMKEAFAHRLVVRHTTVEMDGLGLSASPEVLAVLADDEGNNKERLAPLLPDEVVARAALIGPAERAVATLADALLPEISHVTIRPYAGPGERVEDTIRAFAEQVLPAALAKVGRVGSTT